MNKTKNWSSLFQDYKGLWVAFGEDEETVVASGKNAKNTYNQAKKSGLKTPVLFRVPQTSLPHVGYAI